MELSVLKKRLEKVLSPFRYRHSLGVMQLARELAAIYGVDPEKAGIAGLLHDVAREKEPGDLLAIAKKNNIIISETEMRAPLLLHGKVGSSLLFSEWGITDPEILTAIGLHVTGAPEMSLFSQVIFIADFAEPGRGFFSSEVARTLAKSNRVSVLHYVFQQEITYLLNHGYLLENSTVEAWNQLIIHGDLIHGGSDDD